MSETKSKLMNRFKVLIIFFKSKCFLAEVRFKRVKSELRSNNIAQALHCHKWLKNWKLYMCLNYNNKIVFVLSKYSKRMYVLPTIGCQTSSSFSIL